MFFADSVILGWLFQTAFIPPEPSDSMADNADDKRLPYRSELSRGKVGGIGPLPYKGPSTLIQGIHLTP